MMTANNRTIFALRLSAIYLAWQVADVAERMPIGPGWKLGMVLATLGAAPFLLLWGMEQLAKTNAIKRTFKKT